MSDFQINEHILHKECESIAKEIFEEITDGMDDDETPEDYRDDMMDRVHEYVDGHGWVIYNYKALMICAHCSVDGGEEFLEDVGMPDTPTIYSLASLIVFGEMRSRIDSEIEDLIENWESAEAA